ncbi:MAG: rod shape-determining protein MreD [Bryobacteraceae bacterium]|nr:rod shape-determining protein MreD [Bryobacteraceae bacterium]
MSDFTSDRLLSETRIRKGRKRFRPLTMIVVPLIAILFQVYLPRFFQYLGYLELPLLVTVYYALMARNPIPGLLFGAVIGLAQDSLSHHPLGMFGITKTLVGYFAASVSTRFDVDNPFLQFVLGFFFFFFHQFFYWMLTRALLGRQIDFDLQQTFFFGLLNAIVAVPLFVLLDRIRE